MNIVRISRIQYILKKRKHTKVVFIIIDTLFGYYNPYYSYSTSWYFFLSSVIYIAAVISHCPALFFMLKFTLCTALYFVSLGKLIRLRIIF